MMLASARFRAFYSDQSGTVTIDWVVLTASLVGMALATMNIVGNQMQTLALEIRENLDADRYINPFDVPPDDDAAVYIDPNADPDAFALATLMADMDADND
ncbi:MAG: hypothetical protein AAF914_00810 [Pseudomonadota bacterium]